MNADEAGPPGELIGRGRTADVFALGDDSVLRRYRDGQNAEPEGKLIGHLTRQSFPVPLVHSAHGGDLVMERLYGPTMLGALIAGEMDIETAMTVLAELHRALRQVGPPPDALVPTGHGLIHLDLHPDNVIMEPGRGPVLIDWNNAEIGPGDLDVAMTALIMAEVAVNPDGAELVGALHDQLRHAVGVFLAAAGGAPVAQLGEAVRRRVANVTLSEDERRASVRAGDLVVELAR
ncbi:phosphotransferase [Occultella aeris]|uniref:Phosphotransferase enzyme family protein n=1 Tax=Occultella aeris TaxID=2761496 RepID=A0A7M4DDC0_9MICO|nr:phosphotransferase [Occultella aeris]VZO34839.1 Phosphotransferase enzyme family protein [Occultella aeris]